MKSIYLALFVLAFSGCYGVRFNPASVNDPIPEAFTKRTLYPAGIAGYDFQDLVGNVLLIREGADPLRIAIIRPDNYEIKAIPIEDPNNYYRSRIQKGAEVQGTYLAFAAALNVEDMVELTLTDISRAGIAIDSNVIWENITRKAAEWVKFHPKKDTAVRRLWIKSAVLSRKNLHKYDKISANARSQVGEVTGVKTGVYLKSEQVIKSVILGFEAFDIDELVNQFEISGFIPSSRDDILNNTRVESIIKGTLGKEIVPE